MPGRAVEEIYLLTWWNRWLGALLEAETESFQGTSDNGPLDVSEKAGATRRIRTADLLITNQLLYRLS